MKTNNKIISEYKEKINILIKHNKLYFSKDNPNISDAEYDELKKDVVELEKKFPYLKKYGSFKSIIGSPPSNKFKKIKHLRPMLSLSNAFDSSDMIDFITKILNFFLNQKLMVFLQL